MILNNSKDYQILYVDKDQEEFEFDTKWFSIDKYLDIWRRSLQNLHEIQVPVLLPVYIDFDDNQADIQGYIIYPYKSQWIMIDSGVYQPRDEDIAKSYKHIDPIESTLPVSEPEWQSHWCITGKDLTTLSKELGLDIVFENIKINDEPLTCEKTGDVITIYASKKKFEINIASFVNKTEVADFAKKSISEYYNEQREYAIVPANAHSDHLQMYILFRRDDSEYIAQFFIDKSDRTLDFEQLDTYLSDFAYKPYLLNESPEVFSLHARYSTGTARCLFDVL